MATKRVAPRYNDLRPASPAASRAKRHNPAQGTAAELLLRRRLWSLGLRYRLHAKDLPGKPDLVFRRQRLAVFVDGDFWHGRNWEKRRASLEKGHNAPYWIDKIAYNIERDRRNDALLEQAGWRVLRLWETDVTKQPSVEADRVVKAVRDRERIEESPLALVKVSQEVN